MSAGSITDLRGKNVLVTGAAGALGTATVRLFAEAGANLALSDRDSEALARTVEIASAFGVRVTAIECDVLDDDQLGALVSRAEAELGPLDVVISSAGIEFNACFEDVSFVELDRQLAIHLRSPMQLIHSALPGMLDRGRGHVVVVSSLNGKVPFPCKVPYSAAKAGSIAMVHALRREYHDRPVGFSVVMPALVTGDGQAARAMASSGIEPPKGAPTATAEQCAEAIRDAILENRPEVAVSSRSTKLIAALQWSLPGVADGLLERSGMPDFWRKVAGMRRVSVAS
jgi:NAD(P)-dependent dehydrogenase (short-subunit alcohol dehydrogenase family)